MSSGFAICKYCHAKYNPVCPHHCKGSEDARIEALAKNLGMPVDKLDALIDEIDQLDLRDSKEHVDVGTEEGGRCWMCCNPVRAIDIMCPTCIERIRGHVGLVPESRLVALRNKIKELERKNIELSDPGNTRLD